MEPLELTLTQKFELEKYQRIIRETEDLAGLKSLAETLFQAWQSQKAATQWLMRQNLSKPYVSSLPTAPTTPAEPLPAQPTQPT
jgi:hypothetical protein